jgi:hypothetical protein
MAGSYAAFSSIRKIRLAAKRIVFVTIMFLFEQVIHSLD